VTTANKPPGCFSFAERGYSDQNLPDMAEELDSNLLARLHHWFYERKLGLDTHVLASTSRGYNWCPLIFLPDAKKLSKALPLTPKKSSSVAYEDNSVKK